MEIQLPTPDSSQEMKPNLQPGQLGGEVQAVPAPEVAPAVSVERQGTEQQTQGQGGDPAWQAPQLPTVPVQAQPLVQAAPTTAPLTDTPLTAGDDDLIEQEWVAKAKQIVASTKNDPYTQEREVSKLQADYLQKRFGKELKLSSD